MTKRLLIDAAHSEEVRVAVAEDQRLLEFDYESQDKRQLKGNIYLAKVTRVEPSLQAAFVEYGGNRQGFLPFSEIHYDYFQIPVDDKKKLEEAELAQKPIDETPAEEEEKADSKDTAEESVEGEDAESRMVEEDLGDELQGEKKFNRNAFYRKYKIQEVIKRNQIILIQVIKEERGHKGASLTTYISLPGRYCVYMPNTSKQGGVSRRITSGEDRKRLRKIVDDLDVSPKSSIIVRTAGVDRNKTEIKRDHAYLVRLWNDIRDVTLSSEAPALIYEEGDLIKRSLRDMYTNDVDEIIVEGDGAVDIAKKFLKTITPTHVKKVKEYDQPTAIFSHYGVEDELNKLYDSEVDLPSGGSIVINPTEALVSIDVNSGKATKERNIEETAVKTNQEAAAEIARQLRLRDLAGLVVIDFIDMLQLKNKKAIERALKDALRSDRARIQVGRISTFGLLEMSRQRLRASIIESSTSTCPMCKGTGKVRSAMSSAVTQLRAIERAAANTKRKDVVLNTSIEAAMYLLNNKRDEIMDIEEEFNVTVTVNGDHSILGGEFHIDGESRNQSGNDRSDRKRNRRNNRKDRNQKKGQGQQQNRKVSYDSVSGSDSEDEVSQDDSVAGDEEAPVKKQSKGSKKPTAKGKKPANKDEDNASDEKQAKKPAKGGKKPAAKKEASDDEAKGSSKKPPAKKPATKKADNANPSEKSDNSNNPADHANENGVISVTPEGMSEEDQSVLRGLWNKITN